MTRLPRSTVYAKLAGAVLVLGTWELVVRLFAPAYVARPTGILRVLPETLASAGMLRSAGITLRAVLEGLLIAVVSGTLVGLAMGRLRVVERLLGLYVNGLYAMPMVAILPLLTIWFGYSSAARLATVVFASFFPIAMNAGDGARSVPAEYLEVARACRARWTDVWFGITLPSSLPYLLAGVRLAIGRALVRGKSMTNVVPLPTSLATLMRPPSCSTILREMARPRPRPRRLVVTKSSKTACRRSGGMPQPVS